MKQASLLGVEPPFRVVPPPPLWGPDGSLLLPDEVLLIAMDQPYAGLLADEIKVIETRTWPFPYAPCWMAIYATRTPDQGAIRRLGEAGPAYAEPRGVILALVWVGGCRPMMPIDEVAACIPYATVAARCTAKGRGTPQAWIIGAAHRLTRPIPLTRGPQKFAHVSKSIIAAALDAPG